MYSVPEPKPEGWSKVLLDIQYRCLLSEGTGQAEWICSGGTVGDVNRDGHAECIYS